MKIILPMILGAFLVSSCASAQEPAAPDQPDRAKPRLSEEQRAQLEQRLDEAWSKLALREKAQLMRFHRAMRDLPPEERAFIRDRLERFIQMPPEQRQRLRQNRERWQQMSPEERERARQEFRRRRQEFEEKWRKEHPGEEPPPFPFHRHKAPPPPPPPPHAPEEPLQP